MLRLIIYIRLWRKAKRHDNINTCLIMGFCFNSECASWQVDIICIVKENKRSSSRKVVFITKTKSVGLHRNVHLCSLISAIKSCTQNYECDSMYTLRSAKPVQRNLPKNTVV